MYILSLPFESILKTRKMILDSYVIGLPQTTLWM